MTMLTTNPPSNLSAFDVMLPSVEYAEIMNGLLLTVAANYSSSQFFEVSLILAHFVGFSRRTCFNKCEHPPRRYSRPYM